MDLFTRLVVALETIAKALIAPTNPVEGAKPSSGNGLGAARYQATTADLSYVSPMIIEQAQAASVQFAIDNQKVPWSEAHMRAVMEYEAMVEKSYGPGSSEQLPWRRVVPRGEEIKHERQGL